MLHGLFGSRTIRRKETSNFGNVYFRLAVDRLGMAEFLEAIGTGIGAHAGRADAAKGQVMLRDMENSTQREIPLKDLEDELAKL